jgi:uncharacterized protein YkwD
MRPFKRTLVFALLVFLFPACGDDDPRHRSTRPGNGGEADEENAPCTLEDDPECPLDCDYAVQWPALWIEQAEEVVDLINLIRAEGTICGDEVVPPSDPLTMNPSLAQASRCHSQDMGEHSELTHIGSDGSTFFQRALDAGYEGSPRAENAAAGYSTPASVVAGWQFSSGHCRNMTRDDIDEVGIGLAVVVGSSYTFWWTAKFGTQ